MLYFKVSLKSNFVQFLHKFSDSKSYEKRRSFFQFVTLPHVWWVMWLYVWTPLIHPVKCCDHWSSGSGYINYFIHHTTSQHLVIKGSCSFTRGSSSLYVVTYPKIFWEYRFQQGISGQEPQRTYLWTLNNKHVWMAQVENVIIMYLSIASDSVRAEFIKKLLFINLG